jgi:Ca-activated chloride channel homolog
MRRGMNVALAIFAMVLAASPAWSQSIRSLVNGGNDLYKEEKYTDAEVNYRKALDKEKELVQGHFNLGNALAKEGKFDEAMKEFAVAGERAESPETKGHAWYNIGNSLMGGQKYQEAVDAYVKSLQLNPRDQEAKYNLSYALEKLKQQQQQQKQDKNQDKKNQDKKNQDKKDQQNKDQQQKQDQQKQDQKKQDQKQNPQQNQQQPQPQEKQMSKADAQRILDVLKNNEKEVQKKLRVRQAVRPKTDKDW